MIWSRAVVLDYLQPPRLLHARTVLDATIGCEGLAAEVGWSRLSQGERRWDGPELSVRDSIGEWMRMCAVAFEPRTE